MQNRVSTFSHQITISSSPGQIGANLRCSMIFENSFHVFSHLASKDFPHHPLSLPFIFTYFLTSSPRMYSDGSVTKKGWSINWRAIPDWSSPIITISTLWPPKLAPILTADRRVPQWICFNQSANKYSMKIYHRLRFIFQFWTIHQLNSFFFGDHSVYVLNCPWMLIVREIDVLFFVFFLE